MEVLGGPSLLRTRIRSCIPFSLPTLQRRQRRGRRRSRVPIRHELRLPELLHQLSHPLPDFFLILAENARLTFVPLILEWTVGLVRRSLNSWRIESCGWVMVTLGWKVGIRSVEDGAVGGAGEVVLCDGVGGGGGGHYRGEKVGRGGYARVEQKVGLCARGDGVRRRRVYVQCNFA